MTIHDKSLHEIAKQQEMKRIALSEAEQYKRQLMAEWLADAPKRQRRRRIGHAMRIFLCMLLFLAFMPAISYAAPIFAFLLGPSGLALFTGSTLTIVSSVLGFVTTTAATYFIGQLFMEDPPEEKEGVRLDLATGDVVPQSFIMGTYATAGSLCYAGTFGNAGKTPNAFLVQVIAVGDLPYAAINQKCIVDNVNALIDTETTEVVGGRNFGHPVPKFMRKGKNHLWIKFKSGEQTTQDGYLADVFNGLPARSLDANFVGRGRAYVIITTRYNPKLFGDAPAVLMSFDGIKLYDPRKDSTNGGSGSHRYGNYNTYEFSANNKVIHYNAKRGIYWGNQVEWMWGGQGLDAFLLDNDTWFAAMNECDVNVSLKGGGTEKAHRMGVEIDCTSNYADFSETLDRCTNGRTSIYGGVYKTYVGAIGAPVYSFTDNEVLVTLEQTNKFIPAVEDMFNAAVGEFIEPGEGWQTKSTKPRTIAAYLAEDAGNGNETRIALPYITKNSRAQRIVNAMLKESRRTRTHLIALGPEAFRLEPLDVVGWTSTKYQYTNKKFIIGSIQPFRDQGYIVIAIREADPNDFSWTPLIDEADDDIETPDDIDEADQVLPVTVSPHSIKNNAGVAKKPGILVEWDAEDEDLADIKWVSYQVRLLDTEDDNVPDGQTLFEKGKIVISAGLIKQEYYQVRVMPIPFSDRPVEWGPWYNVLTPNVGEDVNDDMPPDLGVTPTMVLKTRLYRDGRVKQVIRMYLDTTGRSDKETYEIRVTDNSESPADIDYYPVKSFPRNFEVQANHDYAIRVLPVTRYGTRGNVSALATGVSMPIPKKSTLPSVATNVRVRRKNGGLFFRCDPCTDTDYKETAWFLNTVNNASTADEIARLPGNRYFHADIDLVKKQQYYAWALHYDRSDNSSASRQPGDSSVVYDGVTYTDADNLVLSAPSSIGLTQFNKDVDLDGSVDIAVQATIGIGSAGATDYEFYLEKSPNGVSSWSFVESKMGGLSARCWFKANTQFYYRVTVRAIAWDKTPGNWSSPSSAIKPTGYPGAPFAPTGISVSPLALGWFVQWDACPNLDYAYTEIAVGLASEGNIAAVISNRRGVVFRPLSTTGSTVLYLRHVNTSGQPSSWVSSGSASIGKVDDVDLATNSVSRAKLQAGAAGATATTNGGTSFPNSVNAGAATSTVLILSMKATSTTTGVSITLGSKSLTISYAAQEDICIVSRESGGGSFSATKSGGGTQSNIELIAIGIY